MNHTKLALAGAWIEERVLGIIVTFKANSTPQFLALRFFVLSGHQSCLLKFLLVDIELIIFLRLAIIIPNDELGFAKSYNIMNF